MEEIDMPLSQCTQIRQRFLARFLANSRQHLLTPDFADKLPGSACGRNGPASCSDEASARIGKVGD